MSQNVKDFDPATYGREESTNQNQASQASVSSLKVIAFNITNGMPSKETRNVVTSIEEGLICMNQMQGMFDVLYLDAPDYTITANFK